MKKVGKWKQLTDRELRRIALEQKGQVCVAWSIHVELYVRSARLQPRSLDGDGLEDGECLIPGPYTIFATSRVTNIWAFIVTSLVIVFAVGSFFYRRKK